jgi:hypothetical protein
VQQNIFGKKKEGEEEEKDGGVARAVGGIQEGEAGEQYGTICPWVVCRHCCIRKQNPTGC